MTSHHPYFPQGIRLPDYVANERPAIALIGILFSYGLLILVPSNLLIAFMWPTAPRKQRYIALWYILCGFLHMGFEGYLIRHYKDITGKQTVLAQLWKEYALSDSRYLTGDLQVLCLEFITVFVWGPLSFLTAIWTAAGDPRRIVLQTIVNIAHIYGCTLYYATSLVELYTGGMRYSRPEPQYFWVYFIGFNAPFIIIPLYLVSQALGEVKSMDAKPNRKAV